MRDLQKDLAILDKEYDVFDCASSLPEHEHQQHILYGHREWLKRAIKAEALIQELADELEAAIRIIESYTGRDVNPLMELIAKARKVGDAK